MAGSVAVWQCGITDCGGPTIPVREREREREREGDVTVSPAQDPGPASTPASLPASFLIFNLNEGGTTAEIQARTDSLDSCNLN